MSTTRIKAFGTEPYYDDYFTVDSNGQTVETKNYHRILFRPGYSVQARELTQLQTSLQAQIDRHGQYAFKHGSRVVGGKVTLNTEYDFIKIESSFTHSVGGSLNSDTYLSSLVGTIITGGNNAGTQIQAKVLKVVPATGSDPNTVYIKYITKGGSARNVATFSAGEEFSSSGSTTYYGKVGGGSGSSITNPTGLGAVANIEEGVYFISGTFVHVAAGSLILDKYTNTPSCTVGLSVTESIVDSAADTTLVDNAQGVPNTSAPGATRYQISTTLVKESLTNLNSTDTNYITLLQVEDGKLQVDKTDATNVTTELSKRLARRTFEESGNYAVKPFQLDIREHLDNEAGNNGYLTSASGGVATKIAVGIEPSTAYVQGFRNENIATKYVAIDKPRGANATNDDIGANLATPVGNYVVVQNVKGAPDIETFGTINLHSATNGGGSVIGTARARTLEVIGGEYRLHLFDINMSGSNAFSSVQSFEQSASNGITFKANITGSTPTRIDVGNNSLVFKLPYNTVKTLFNGSNQSSTEYTIKRRFTTSTVNASGNVPVSIIGGNNGHFTNLNTATFIAVGTGDLVQVGASGNPTFDASYGDNVTSIQINGTGAPAGTAVMVLADVEIDASDRTHKNKTIQTVTGYSASLSNGAYPLGKADVYNIISIVDATGTDVKERFTLDDGQRDNFYDISRLIQKPGTSPVSGNLTVSFNWYEHTAGDYFSVDSYPDAHYETIPTFNSSKGLVELRDCIDFRPRKNDNGVGFTGGNASISGAPDPQHAMSMFIEYYMPRIDKLYVTKEGEFKTVTGVPSENPVAPDAPADSMGIYDLRLNPYVFDLQDVNPKLIDNKRYTMRDIGALDKRLKNVEYYTSLSLLEQQAENTQLFTGANPRTKNGFLVDGFRGHNVGDAGNPDYQVAIDKQNGYLRPKFDERNVNLVRASSAPGTVVKSGSLAHLPKTSTVHIKQPYSSVAVNVNPYNVFTWSGRVKLSPESDEWKETDVRPDVIINDEGLYDQFVAMAEESGILGTVWNEWETNWSGVETDVSVTGADVWAGGFDIGEFGGRFGGWGRRGGGRSTTTTAITTTQHQSRTGLTTSIAADTVEKELGNKVVEVNFIPFMRSRRVFFKAELLKPNTKVYAFFNGADITTYTNGHSSHNYAEFSDQTAVKTFEGQTQWVDDSFATSSNSGTLITDSAGSVEGSFIIPRNDALKFKTGTRTFKITDSATNVTTDETTFAEAQFHAEGLIESIQKEIISTKVPSFVTTELNDERTLVDTEVVTTVEWVDPLAQTILIDTEGGIFADSVELFFKKKDANIPVRVSIRSVENGIPTQKIVPGADVVLPAANVNVSTDASASTTFTFDHPVYLAQNQEYAIVIMAQTDDYECYVAEMGGFDLTTPANRITKQPYGGVFFTSQNASTWTPEQSRDLKFTLNRCVFSGSGGHIRMVHDDIPARKLPLNSMSSTSGSGVVTVFHKNHGMQNALSPVVVITGATAFNGLAANNLNGTHNISNVTHDTYQFTAGSSDTASATGSGGGSAIFATENRQMDVLRAVISEVAVPGTSIRYFMTAYTETEVARNEVEILPNRNIIFNSPSSIASTANSNTKTFQLKAVFTTDKDTLSPIIDLNRASLVTVQNIVDNVSSGDELSPTGGNQLARYITKKVELAEEADKIDVFLNVNRPRAADVDFYWRVLEGGSTDDITTLNWTKAPGTNSTATPSVIPINDNPNAFSEIQYAIDPPGSFGTMQFKIVLKSSNSATVPLVKDFRAIAST